MSKAWKLLIAINAVILAAFLFVGWLTDWSFDLSDLERDSEERMLRANADCILSNMKGVSDSFAARSIRRACDEKYPVNRQ